MDTVLITFAWVVGTVVAVVVWRRLVPAPMPAWFDPINTWYRNRAFPPAVALEQFAVASDLRVLELGPAGGYLTAMESPMKELSIGESPNARESRRRRCATSP